MSAFPHPRLVTAHETSQYPPLRHRPSAPHLHRQPSYGPSPGATPYEACPVCGNDPQTVREYDMAMETASNARRRIFELEEEVRMLTRKATDAVERMADYEDEIRKMQEDRVGMEGRMRRMGERMGEMEDQEKRLSQERDELEAAIGSKTPPQQAVRKSSGHALHSDSAPYNRVSTSPAPAAGGPPSRPPSRPPLSLGRALSFSLGNRAGADSRPSSSSSNPQAPVQREPKSAVETRPPPNPITSSGFTRLSSFLMRGNSLATRNPIVSPSAASTVVNQSPTVPSMPNSGNIVAGGSDVGLPSPFPIVSPDSLGQQRPVGGSDSPPPPAPIGKDSPSRYGERELGPAAQIRGSRSTDPLASPQTLTLALTQERHLRTTAEQRLSTTQFSLSQTEASLSSTRSSLNATQTTLAQTQSTLAVTQHQLAEAKAALESHIETSSSEIEELSASLFGQANEMVASERRLTAKLEEKVRELEERLRRRGGRLDGLERRVGMVERVRGVLADGPGAGERLHQHHH